MRHAVFALSYACAYAALAGFAEPPRGAAAAVLAVLLLYWMAASATARGCRFASRDQFLICCGAVAAFSFAFVTNSLLNILSAAVVALTAAGLLGAISRARQTEARGAIAPHGVPNSRREAAVPLFHFVSRGDRWHAVPRPLWFAFFVALLYAAYELVSLQCRYGVKDTRLIASVVVFGALAACSACALRTPALTVRLPVTVLFAVTILADLLNLDDTISKWCPPRVVIDGVDYKDYAYLLTNSYDNYRQWGSLMLEMMDQRQRAALPLRPPHCSGEFVNKFTDHLARVQQLANSGGFLAVNLRHRSAARWAGVNAGLISDFDHYLRQGCPAEAKIAREAA